MSALGALKVGDLAMPEKKPVEPFKVGDLVKIRYSGFKRARIIEERGPIGPGGQLAFRVRVRRKPRPKDIDVLEEQLVHLPQQG
jgi:hypothetical protein